MSVAIQTFQQALRLRDFAITAELPFGPPTSAAALRSLIDTLGPAMDALQVSEDRRAEGRMAGLAAAALVRERGFDPLLHLSCRDRNRIALQGELLGAVALGVSSIIPHRGRKLPDTLRGKVKAVFDSTPVQLIEMACRIGEHAALDEAPQLLVGSFVTVVDPGEQWQAVNINEKLDAGARLLQTLPCLNLPLLERYAARLVAMRTPHRGSLVVDVPLLESAAFARELKDIYPGSPIPPAAIERIERSANPRATAIRQCAEALRTLATLPGISGANIVFESDPEAVLRALDEAGLRRTA